MSSTLTTTAESSQLQAGLVADDGLGTPSGSEAEETMATGAQSGAYVSPIGVTLPAVPGTLGGSYLYDYYYRIWVTPSLIVAQNPVVGQPIPFDIWNAYPQPVSNSLVSITGTGLSGLSLDIAPGDIWKAIETKTVNLTITPAAPIEIDAEYTFTFDEGVGLFYFQASIADFVQMVPDPPVVERWSWLTDVIPARDGSEQRIALRSSPRRSIQYSFLLESEIERQRQYNRWYKSLASRIVLPFYQYSTRITAASTAGTSKLFFDPDRTDLRNGEFALVYDNLTEAGYLVKINTLEADGAIVDSPLSFSAGTSMVISPAFVCRLEDRTGLRMNQITGDITVQAESLTVRPLFARPESSATVQTFDSLPVLDRRPIADGFTPETFDVNYEVIDGETGISELFSAWDHPAVRTARKYTIRRLQDPNEMDWWRDFLDEVRGQQNPFLQPTWFADLTLASSPSPGDAAITINQTDYVSLYFPYNTYKRLQIETANGIIWRSVLDATDNGDGTATLQLSAAFGANPEDVDIDCISFLNLTRLQSDTVTITHGAIRTEIELATRTIDA